VKILILFLLLFCFLVNVSTAQTGDISAGKQQPFKFEARIIKKVRLNYLLFLPQNYNLAPQQKWPLILFLHGAGERGDDLELVRKHGIPKIVEQREDFPFIVVSPQCPEDSRWTDQQEALIALIDQVLAKYSVDPDKVYLTGLSMGGTGTWALAMAYPKRFSAVIPICGKGDPSGVCVLKDIPVWVFHGAKDDVVPPENSEKMVNALKECGGKVQFTLYPDAGHDSWTATYDNPEFYSWLLNQSKPKKQTGG